MEFRHTYTVVIHALRNHLKLSPCDYFVVDAIEVLSSNNQWCYKSKANIARDIFASQRKVSYSINKLLKLGLIEKKDGEPNCLRTTSLWSKTKMEFKERIGQIEESNIVYEKTSQVINNKDIQDAHKIPETVQKVHTRIKQKNKEENKEQKEILNSFIKF